MSVCNKNEKCAIFCGAKVGAVAEWLELLVMEQKVTEGREIETGLRTPTTGKLSTVQILCIGTDRSQQTVQTKIRLLLKKQSDQGLRCLPFHQHLWVH